ncbi:MAG: hypothetical protein J0I41_19665 [Filimonas sp.]|nr:hypothetical protein [Filimonas sp.]
MKNKIKILFAMLAFIWFNSARSQVTHNVPPTPEVATLGTFGRVPIGPFTGTSNVNIQVCELKSRQLSVSLSLNYISSGVKVEEISPWTGANWALSGVGVITQVINANKDDRGTHPIPSQSTTNGWDNLDKKASMVESADNEADVFYYSLPGRSGKCFLTDNGNAYTIPREPIQVTGLYQNNDVPKIVDENGNIYVFDYKTVKYTTVVDPPIGVSGATKARVISWYLTKILSADLTDSITFSYTKVTTTYQLQHSSPNVTTVSAGITGYVSSYAHHGPSDIRYLQGNKLNVTEDFVYLSQINCPRGYVNFTAASRSDPYISGLKQLSSIEMYSSFYNRRVLKKNFEYQNTGSRLFLNRIVDIGNDDTEISAYSMEYYNPAALPDRQNFNSEIDAWGYWNSNTAGHLIPWAGYAVDGLSSFADRKPDRERAFYGSLYKLSYPTKGYTRFYYELNTIAYGGYYTKPSPKSGHEIGGLRIRRIEDYDGILAQPSNVRKYEYVGEGLMAYNPIFSSQFESNKLDQNNTYECNADHVPIFYITTISGDNQAYASSIQGSHVVYPKVKESIGENGEKGSTVYEYSTDGVNADGYGWMYGVPTDLLSYRAGLLKKKIDYNSAGYKVQEATNTYSFSGRLSQQQGNFKTLRVREIWGLNEGTCSQYDLEEGVDPVTGQVSAFGLYYYYLTTEWIYKTNEDVKIYDLNDEAKYVQTTKEFQYNNEAHQQLTQTKFIKSNGIAELQRTLYPHDFSFPSNSTDPIAQLQQHHMLAAPVEKLVYSQLGSSTPVINSGEATYYYALRPQYVHRLAIEPGYESLFTEGLSSGSYFPYAEYFYNSYGLPVAMSKDKFTVNWAYGYNSTLPIVESRGIGGPANDAQVANAVGSVPGYSANNLDLLLADVSDMDTQAKIDKWKQFNARLRQISGPSEFTTYTYNPMIGITSQTNARGVMNIFKYDSDGRLKSLTDEEGNVLKVYEYNYTTNAPPQTIYARQEIKNIDYYYGSSDNIVSTDEVYLKFYQDIECTIPYTWSGTGTINFTKKYTKETLGVLVSQSSTPLSVSIPNGATQVLLDYLDTYTVYIDDVETYTFEISPSSSYHVVSQIKHY